MATTEIPLHVSVDVQITLLKEGETYLITLPHYATQVDWDLAIESIRKLSEGVENAPRFLLSHEPARVDDAATICFCATCGRAHRNGVLNAVLE